MRRPEPREGPAMRVGTIRRISMDAAYFRPSMASIATRIRNCGAIWIKRPRSTEPGSTPRRRLRLHLAGFAVCLWDHLSRSCIRASLAPGFTNSRNAGVLSARVADIRPLDSALRFRWLNSRRSARDILFTPCLRASSPAAAHNLSGIADLPAALSPLIEARLYFFNREIATSPARHCHSSSAGLPDAE
jgi:hypothetical protein